MWKSFKNRTFTCFCPLNIGKYTVFCTIKRPQIAIFSTQSHPFLNYK